MRGHRSVIVIPQTQAHERDAAAVRRADLRLVPFLPYSNPGNYGRYSEALAKEIARRLMTQIKYTARP